MRGTHYRAHRTVIFVIAQLSCFSLLHSDYARTLLLLSPLRNPESVTEYTETYNFGIRPYIKNVFNNSNIFSAIGDYTLFILSNAP